MSKPAPEELLQSIRSTYEALKSQDFYERLGVDRQADMVSIKKSYTQLAAKWHPDRYSQYTLGAAENQLQQVFALYTEAYSNLSNPAKREEYDAKLRFSGGGMAGRSVDPRAVFEADSTFKLGQQLLEQGKAKAALDKFNAACDLNPDSPVFLAYKTYAEYLSLGRDKDGKPGNKRRAEQLRDALIQLIENTENFDVGHVFLGMIYQDAGDDSRARHQFLTARSLNPKNVQAQRQLRLMNMRQDKKDNLLEKIKGFFNKKL